MVGESAQRRAPKSGRTSRTQAAAVSPQATIETAKARPRYGSADRDRLRSLTVIRPRIRDPSENAEHREWLSLAVRPPDLPGIVPRRRVHPMVTADRAA